MTQAKHTPGPWTVSELDATGEVSEYHIFIEPGVAVIERKIAGHDQNDMADALLLSAAPDLLGACEAMIAWDDAEKNALPYDSDKGVAWYGRLALCAKAFEKARVAIAKATGSAA